MVKFPRYALRAIFVVLLAMLFLLYYQVINFNETEIQHTCSNVQNNTNSNLSDSSSVTVCHMYRINKQYKPELPIPEILARLKALSLPRVVWTVDHW